MASFSDDEKVVNTGTCRWLGKFLLVSYYFTVAVYYDVNMLRQQAAMQNMIL